MGWQPEQISYQISTGPVVAFRSKEQFVKPPEKEQQHYIGLHNVVKMLADHPVVKEGKPQFIHINEMSVSTLLPNKNYVLLRRFSSKDDNSRLIAAPYFGNMTSCAHVGIENKLNYIYRPKRTLEPYGGNGIAPYWIVTCSILFQNIQWKCKCQCYGIEGDAHASPWSHWKYRKRPDCHEWLFYGERK